jgi:gamma-glutamyltranspeptidase/glutathione hydrolase
MLRLGGNAADAALATAFSQCVVNPIHCGIAGSFHGIFYSPGAGATCVIGGERAPKAAYEDMWQPTGRLGATFEVAGDRNLLGYEASVVPGFVRGAFEAYTAFGSGRVSWRTLIEPAIELATDGFKVYPYLYRLWMPHSDLAHGFLEYDGPRTLQTTAPSRAVYLKDGERVFGVGEVLRQPDYAATLTRIAEQGPDEFYVGETGRRIADDFQGNGGLLSAEDLAEYRADVEPALSTSFRKYEVLTESSPSVGPVMLEILNIIEGWNLEAFGWNSAPYLDRLARSMHFGFRDRMTLLADPDFIEIPLQRLISKDYAADLRSEIEAQLSRQTKEHRSARPAPSGGTTSLSVVDKAGNAAAIVHSLGTSSGVVTPGLGFLHNNHMNMFNPHPGQPNSIAPWKRSITGGAPAVFARDNAAVLTISGPAGSRKVTSQIQVLLNIDDFNMDFQTALSVDRIHVEDEPMTIIVEPYFPADTLMQLAQLGYRIDYEWYAARLTGVHLDSRTGELVGGRDQRGAGGLAVV